MIIAAPTDCTSRNAISGPTPQAVAPPSEAAQNTTRPARKTRRRPNRLAIRRDGASRAANPIV